jgi:hypothetical protein
MAILFWNSRVGLPVFLMFNSRLLQILHDPILHTPPQKVQLGARCREPLELNTLRPAEGIKELLAVPIQTRFVSHVDCKHLTSWCRICHVIVLCVVCDEPLQFPERNTLAVPQNIVKFFAILWYIKKFGEARQKKLRLTHW